MVTGFHLRDISVLEFHVVEPVTDEDLSALSAALRESGRPKVLLVVAGDTAPSPRWAEAQTEHEAAEPLEVALVAPAHWFDTLNRLIPRSPDVRAHHFGVDRREAALRWLLS